MENKESIRKTALSRRKTLTQEEMKKKSSAICRKLLQLPLNRVVPELDDAIAGNFFLCGLCDTEDGGDFCSLSPEDMKEFESRFYDPQLFRPTPLGIVVRSCTPAQYDRIMGHQRTEPIVPGEER